MENAGVQASWDRRPHVAVSLPPIQRFTGRLQDHDSSGILDFIQQIEEYVGYSYYETSELEQAAKLSLFRRNLDHDAKRHLESLSAVEKSNWKTLKDLFIKEFKTNRDQKAKEDAWIQAATIKQKKDESVKAYADRALRVSQLVDTDERYLVRRFVTGIRDPGLQQTLAAAYEDLNKATMRELHRKIHTIVAVSNRYDDDDEDDDNRCGIAHGGTGTAGPKLTAEGAIIRDLEERLRRIELNAPQVEVLAVGAGQNAGGAQGHQHQQWNGYGRPRQQGRGYQQQANQTLTCYNCGQPGHISRYCPDATPSRSQPVNPIMVFPGPNGSRTRMRWVTHPPHGLPPGYYAVDEEPATPAAAGPSPRGGPPASQGPAGAARITDVTDVAAVEAGNPATFASLTARDLVKYVGPNEVHAVERRKLPEVLTDSHSEERPPQHRPRYDYEPEEMEVSEASQGDRAERITPEASAGGSRQQEEDTVRVRAGRSQPQEEDIGRFRAVRRPQQEGESLRQDPGRRQATVEMEDDVVEVAAGPAVRKQVKKVCTPKAPRHIRMMLGQPGFDVLAEFREMPVPNLKWGALLDMAPSLRRVVGTGLLLEQQPRKPKKVQKGKAVEALAVNTRFQETADEEPCVNFYTVASVSCGGQDFKISRTLIDAGSVVNLASHAVLERMGAPLLPAYDLTIRTATSTLTTIKYYSDLDVSVAGVSAHIRVYAIPHEIMLSYGLLLSR